jgi:membrane protein
VTEGGNAPPRSKPGAGREPPILSWRARLEAFQRSVMRRSAVAGVLDVTRAYDRSGGGMLAGALAYFAFFTMVPALLLFVGLLGILVEDQKVRQNLIEALVGQVQPVADLSRFIVNNLADTGRIGTVVGIIGLVWGASGFYGALQGAMQRMFPGPGGRDFLNTRIRGTVTVVFILGSMLMAVVVLVALPLVTDWKNEVCATLSNLDAIVVNDLCAIDLVQIGWAIQVVGAMAVAFLVALVVYVAVPPDGATIGQAFWPAVIVGIIIGSFTSLFGLIAPLLVRYWQGLGFVGGVFIALIWFNLVFQALIYGAAFARIRRDRDRLSEGSPLL